MGTVTSSSRMMSFRLPRDLADRLQAVAADRGVSASQLVAAAVAAYLPDTAPQLPEQLPGQLFFTEGGTED